MRLTAQVRVALSGQEKFRKPSFWDKAKSFLGSDVDLRTGELQLTTSALALAEDLQKALTGAGLTNAVSLLVDRDPIYVDDEGKTDDAQLLQAAIRRHAARLQQPFAELRMVFEHKVHGLHILLEGMVRSSWQQGEVAVVLAMGARILELEPGEGEALEVAKERIGKALGQAELLPTYKAALDQQVQKVAQQLRRVFAGAQVEIDAAEVSVVKPSRDAVAELGQAGGAAHEPWMRAQPQSGAGWGRPYYDPWGTYYHDPMNTFVNLMIIDSLLHPRPAWGWGGWGHYGAPVTIVNYNGVPYGSADQIHSFGGQLQDVSAVANQDFSAGSWDDSQLGSYDASAAGFQQYSSGDVGTFDCAGSSAGSADCSWDCSSDCSFDCSSDCSFDCSSDCSSDW